MSTDIYSPPRPTSARRMAVGGLTAFILALNTVAAVGSSAVALQPDEHGSRTSQWSYLFRDAYSTALGEAIQSLGPDDSIHLNTPGMHWVEEAGCAPDAPESNLILCDLQDAHDRGAEIRISVGAEIIAPDSSAYSQAAAEFLDDSDLNYRINGRHAKVAVIQYGTDGASRDAFIGSHNLTLHSLASGWSTSGPASGAVANEASLVYETRPGRSNPAVEALVQRADEFLDQIWNGTLEDETEPEPYRGPSPYLLLGQQFIHDLTRQIDAVRPSGTVDLVVYNLGLERDPDTTCGWVSDRLSCDALLVDALTRAADRGVSVRVMVDDRTFQAAINGADAVDALVDSGVSVRLDPCSGSVGSLCGDLGSVTHMKQTIVDRRTAYIGSHNYYHGSDYTGLNGRGEATVRTSSPRVLHQAQNAFDTLWAEGRALPDPDSCTNHLAVGASITASSTYNADTPADLAIDGTCADSSRWMSATDDDAPTLTIDLGEPHQIEQINVISGYGWPLESPGHVLVDFVIEAHTGDAWQTLADITDNERAETGWTGTITADKLRLTVSRGSRTAPDIARVYEFAVHGTENSPTAGA